jgi:hypothetical protein
MNQSILKYANLDYSDIVTQILNTIANNPKFANLKESAITQTLVEIFAAATSLNNYYIERRAEECYFDTAKLRSSVILLARQLGYNPIRPIPAKTTLKIVMSGNFVDSNGNVLFNSGDLVQIPLHSVFTYNGNNYILQNTFTYTVTSQDSTNMLIQGEDFSKELIVDDYKNDITLLQGEIKEKIIDGATNPLFGQKFQVYKIEDTTFSNYYGTGEDLNPPLTRIWVGNTKSNSTEYLIDRRSLINWQTINNANFNENSSPLKICVVRTAVTEDIEIKFGDGKYADYGALTSQDNIYVQYLGTIGSKANESGAINKDITFSGNVYNKNGVDITSNFQFKLNSNIIGGADLESIDSIKNNAPGIYYALDRLVSKKDYVNFLKTMTSPIVVKNALAWGEQEEIYSKNLTGDLTDDRVVALNQLYNVVFFTCLGSLYETTVSPHYPKTIANGLDSSVLDLNFDEDGLNSQSYFNIYTKANVVQQLKRYNVDESYWQLNGETITSTSAFNGSSYLVIQYGSDAQINVTYASQNISDGPGLIDVANLTLDFSDLSGSTSADVLSQVALKMKNGLRTIVDNRGGSRTLNANYQNAAFSDIDVTYITSAGNIQITNTTIDPCFVTSISSPSATSGYFFQQAGFNNSTLDKFNTQVNVEMSGKITDVISKLQDRAQPTLRHVYVSPIIQNFDLSGTVYVDSLFDRKAVQLQVEDTIYEWLNQNADFNIPIYKSSISDIITSIPGVNHTNFKLLPEEVIGTPYYNTVNGGVFSATINSYAEHDLILSAINYNLNDFMTLGGSVQTDFNNYNVSAYSNALQSYSFSWNNFINERNFQTYFMKNTYTYIKTPIYDPISNTSIPVGDRGEFANGDDFLLVMSGIRKDFLKIIRWNMLDIEGNIAQEFRDNKYYKGFYSLGSEIPKINIKLSYIYN